MLNSSLSNYIDAYIIITLPEAGADAALRQQDKRNKQVTLKNCAPFTDCILEIHNARVDNTKDLDIAMPMRNLI